MTYVKITDKNGKPIDESNPLPVTGGGTGGSLEVDIVANSAGLATAQGQQDIVDAINNLSDASSEIYTDSVSIDDTGVQLPDLPIGEVIIQNDQDSGQDIYIGNDTDQELRLKAGEWVSVRITNLNLIYAKTSTGTATLRYFARSAAGIPGGGSSPVPVELTGSNALKGAVQTVTTAGSRVQLPNYACREVTIIALRTNTGRIYVGGSDVSSTVYGADLGPRDSITITVSNTNLIYIDASVSGEGVSYVAV